MTAWAGEMVNRLRRAAIPQLAVLADHDLDVPAGDLDSTCREILEHLALMPFIWASRVATRSHENDYVGLAGPSESTGRAVLGTLDAGLAVFADVVCVMPAAARAAHSAGLSDSVGWAAMLCDEVLVHSWDITQGMGAAFEMPEELVEAILDRLFPWAGAAGTASQRLLLVNGRRALGDRAAIRDWVWHCGDPAAWDGAIPSDKTLRFLPMTVREVKG